MTMAGTAIEYPHLTVDPASASDARLTRLPRIRVSMIVGAYLGHGWSADQIAEQHPHLRRAEIHAALAYYYDHRHDIEAQLREELNSGGAGAGEPSSLALKLAAAKANWKG